MIELHGAQILQLADLVDDVQALDLPAFAEKNGKAYLMLQGGIEGLRTPSGPIKTVMLDSDTLRERRRPALEFLIWPVRNAGRSAYQSFISIGRTANNDIFIPDESVSRVHALIAPGSGGQLLIKAMAGAKPPLLNGDEDPLTAGTGAELTSGDTLQLGNVELTFLDVEAVVDLVQRSARSGT